MRYMLSLVFAFVLTLVMTTVGYAQDSVQAVVDTVTASTNSVVELIGPAIQHYWPAVALLLQSATLKVFTWISTKALNWSEPVKWGALFALGLAYNYAGTKLGWGHSDPHTWTYVGAAAAIQTFAAAMVYKFAQIKVG